MYYNLDDNSSAPPLIWPKCYALNDQSLLHATWQDLSLTCRYSGMQVFAYELPAPVFTVNSSTGQVMKWQNFDEVQPKSTTTHRVRR